MELLIDGDIIIRKCAYVTENMDEGEAMRVVDDYINSKIDYFMQFLSRDGEYGYEVYVKGDTSFRKELCPDYHANRKDKKDPKHMGLIRQHLIDKWAAKPAKNGFEVDDVLGYRQTSLDKRSVIFSIDKDLLQIPGYHFNLDNHTLTYVLPYEGIKHFYYQMLVGDDVDNVRGIDGVGPVNAKKLLKGCVTEQQMFEVVQEQYKDDDRMLLNSKLLWLLQKERKNPVEERLA